MTSPSENAGTEDPAERLAAALAESERLDLELQALRAERVSLETERVILESTTETAERILRYLRREEGDSVELADEDMAFLKSIRDAPWD